MQTQGGASVLDERMARGQVTQGAAEIYDCYFVPALFAQWTHTVGNAACVDRGSRTLDVACGTGVLARALVTRIGGTDRISGVDPNESMLEVARRRAPTIDWRQAYAEQLPFEADTFDAVVCQFGLMFFADKVAGLREMLRVLKPGRRLAIAVWDRLEECPGYAGLVKLLDNVCGREIADGLRVPFSLGDTHRLRALCAEAGLGNVALSTHRGEARFRSIRAWIFTNVNGWTFAPQIDSEQFVTLMQQAERELAAFTRADGSVVHRVSAHIIVAQKNPTTSPRQCP